MSGLAVAAVRALFVLTALACSGPAHDIAEDAAPLPSSNKEAGAEPREPTFAPTFAAIYTEVIQPHNCLLGLCHGEGASGGGLSLFPRERAYGELLAISRSKECAHLGFAVVEPEQPEQSLFWIKLQKDPPCGAPMPPDKLVDARHLEQVRSWIERGALED